MFGNERKGSRPPMSVDTLIGAGTTIKGDLSFAGGLHVDGRIEGAVVAEAGRDALLMLSEKGVIAGEIRAPHVVVNGQVLGDIVATERIELAAHAKVEGNIYYKLLEMAAGAQVNGRVVREDEPRKQLPKPEVEAGEDKPLASVTDLKRA